MLNNISEQTLDQIKKGYVYDEKNYRYQCSICNAVFYDGEVYRFEDRFFQSDKAIELHMIKEHESIFTILTESNSKYLTFTDNQKEILSYIAKGLSDNEIAKQMEVSPSTIRHQKFMFREKAKQAKLYLAVYELATEKDKSDDSLISIHSAATMVDDRYVTTNKESEVILKNAFTSLTPLKLSLFPVKQKKKVVILKRISEQFEQGRRYSEKEVNAILMDIFHDYVTIRRYLIEYGFMDRTTDCKEYWLV